MERSDNLLAIVGQLRVFYHVFQHSDELLSISLFGRAGAKTGNNGLPFCDTIKRGSKSFRVSLVWFRKVYRFGDRLTLRELLDF